MPTKKTSTPSLTAAEIDAALRDEARDAMVEREYRLGQLPVSEISRQSGLSRQAIQKRAKKGGWLRDLLPAVQRKVNDELLRDAAPEGALTAEAVDAAAARAIEVVRQHRRSLGRVHRIATILVEDVELYLAGVKEKPAWMGPFDTVAGVMLRVAQALAKAVPLERQAFSVGAGAGDDAPKEPGPALPDWRTLYERAGLRERSDAGAG